MVEPHSNTLLWALSLDGKGGVTQLSDERLEQCSLVEPGQLLWVHLAYDQAQSQLWLRSKGLSSRIVSALCAVDTRPGYMAEGEGALVMLRGINLNADADPEEMISLRLWLEPGLIITSRRTGRKLFTLEDVKNALLAGRGPKTQREFFLVVVDGLTDRIRDLVDKIEASLDRLELAVENGTDKDLRDQLMSLRFQCAEILRYLRPQHAALKSMASTESDLVSDSHYKLLERIERTQRFVEDLELAREKASVLQETIRNSIAEQQNQRMYILSIVTAIFLPLSFLTGVFGMNVSGLPGTENPWGFALVSGSMIALCLLSLVWMRRAKWW